MTTEEIRALEKDNTVKDIENGHIYTYKGKERQKHIFVNNGMQLAIPDHMLDSYAPLFDLVPPDKQNEQADSTKE